MLPPIKRFAPPSPTIQVGVTSTSLPLFYFLSMNTAKKALTEQLVAVLEPYLMHESPSYLAPKAIAKLLRKFAKQVLQQPRQATASKVRITSQVSAPAKPVHKAVTALLTGEIQTYLGTADALTPGPPKALTKSIKRLAKQVVKHQRKQRAVATPLASVSVKTTPKAAAISAVARRPAAKSAAGKASRPTPAAASPASDATGTDLSA